MPLTQIAKTIAKLKEENKHEELVEYYKQKLGKYYCVGEKIGKLTVGEPFYDGIHWKYECICDCGMTRDVQVQDVKKLKNPMCGACITKMRFKPKTRYDLSGEYGIGWDSDDNEFWFDLEDYDKIKDISWHKDKKTGYFTGWSSRHQKKIYLGRFVFGGNISQRIQYRDGNVADNRKQNLEALKRDAKKLYRQETLENRMKRRTYNGEYIISVHTRRVEDYDYLSKLIGDALDQLDKDREAIGY